MNCTSKFWVFASLGIAVVASHSASAQSFGAAKEKVTLQRKLPALIHLPGNSIKVTVTTADEDGALPFDFQALLETELLKDAPDLNISDNPSTQIICQITEYSHPDPIATTRMAPGLPIGTSITSMGKSAAKQSTFKRYTGELDVSLQVKTGAGKLLISDNIKSSYDQEFDSSGNSTAHGMMSSVTGSIRRAKGGDKSEDINPPTPAELRSNLIMDSVQQICEHIVDTNETVDAFLAKKDGPLDEGDKAAETGLWERALETYETATPFPKPPEDSYRLYDIGVAYEALAYQAEDEKATMKYLDEAAINYGKAIDAKPDEKYFLIPQKRIETAIAHYKELDRERQAKAAAAANPAPAAPAQSSGAPANGSDPPTKGLTNAQVIAMVKSGIDEETVIKAIRGADAVDFDLTASGQKNLTSGGVSARVVAAMKIQEAKAPKPAIHKGLTNAQVIAMIKAGMDEATVIQTIKAADAVDFDLTPHGQQALTGGGVSAQVLAAMKARAMRRTGAGASHVASR